MSSTQQLILGEGAGGVVQYQIERSLRFNSADSAYLNRTPASAGNRKTWTYSTWIKRTTLGTRQAIFGLDPSNSDTTNFFIEFEAGDVLSLDGYSVLWRKTTQVFRDPSAWYHIVIAVDTTQATANDRIKVYVNGSQITAFATTNNPTQNADTGINATSAHYISRTTSGLYADNYQTEINFIDGSAKTPSDFGETDTDTGVWKPKAYSGSYGTNGFYLKFADNSGTTSTTLGKDSSGNGNNWTPNNFSVTAGAGNDSLVDTPTPYGTDTGAGGEVRGNYATLNPLDNVRAGGGVTYTNGNLTLTGNAQGGARSTFGLTSGKWRAELTCTSGSRWEFGISNSVFDLYNSNTGKTAFYDSTGYIEDTGTAKQSSLTTCTTGDVITIDVDVDAGTISFYKNGTTQLGTTYTYTAFTPVYVMAYMVSSSVGDLNFGQRPFTRTTSGFKALCTQNLPTPTIGATATTRADDYFNTVLYTGTGSSLGVTGVGFQPDFVWIKSRSAATDHGLYDAVRGVQKQLESNTTTAETTETTGLTAFNTDGFTVGALAQLNTNTATYVAWNWNAGGSNATNTSGTIQSTVRANTTSGFSVVIYTGDGNAASTVGHGLTSPSMVIVKRRSSATTGNTDNWVVKHTSLAGTQQLYLNQNIATFNAGSVAHGGISINTSTIGFLSGTTGVDQVNENTKNYVAYCFAPVAGYSAFGSYTGNGSTDGPFIYTGFRPRYILGKRTDSTGNWLIYDTARDTFNGMDDELSADLDIAETTAAGIRWDALSNGMKMRGSGAGLNASGGTYIYAAFAEFPFKYTLAR